MERNGDSRYLLLGRMVLHLVRQHRRPIEFLDLVKLAAGEGDRRFDAVVALCTSSLHAATALRAVRAHVFNVNCG